ncbi:Aspartate aminotransferase, cytoplasmic [Nymphon striatum]|nr:Aspartate aminotransferase, cytoplasmic [Nymphon striatum]
MWLMSIFGKLAFGTNTNLVVKIGIKLFIFVKMASRFINLEEAPPVEIFAVMKAYGEDTFANKVDLGVGAYRTNEGKPWVLPVVRKVEKLIAADDSLSHEYSGAFGLTDFSDAAVSLLLGPDSPALKENRAIGLHGLSGTGTLRIGAEFLVRIAKFKNLLISSPTWGNHKLLFTHSNFEKILQYRYWDANKLCLDLDGMLEDLRNAPDGSVVLLHACAHNPTGIDPTKDQWKKIAEVIKEKNHFPFFDCAYQGFASGDTDNDAWAVRHFASSGFEFFAAQSFAKNFGLYDVRIGNLTMVFKDPSPIPVVRANMTLLVRGMYSNPPKHGARIISMVLTTPELLVEWKENVKTMAHRIIEMRKILREKLDALGTPGDWSHITTQIGMFSFTGITPPQVKHLVDDYHIYLLKNGRISMCGVNKNNVDYIANAIKDVVSKY